MAVTSTGALSVAISALQQSSQDLATTYMGNPQASFTLGSSVAISKVYFKTLTAAGTPTVLNLVGSLVDAFGQTLTYSTVKALYIYNKDTTNSLTLFGGTHPVIANTFPLTAGQVFCTSSLLSVSGGVSDNLKIDPGANTISFDIMILGA